MELTAQTLREVEFREKLRGYHPDDVDDFLEEAAVALDDLLERLRLAEAAGGGDGPAIPGASRPSAESTGPIPLVRPEPSPARPETTPSPPAPAAVAETQRPPAPQGASSVTEETLRRTLVLAQQTADAAVADAQEAAKRIIDEAQTEARRVTETAEARATELRAQAQARAAQSMAELEEQRSGLEHEVVALRSWAVQQRDRLRDALTDQVRSLDIWLATSAPSSAAVGPKADPAAVGPKADPPAAVGPKADPPAVGPEADLPAGTPDDAHAARGGPTVADVPSDGRGDAPAEVQGDQRGVDAAIPEGSTSGSPDGDRPGPATAAASEAPLARSMRAPFFAAPSTRVPPLAPGGDAAGGAPSSTALVDHEAESGWVDEGPSPDAPGGDGAVPGQEPPPRGFFRGR